MGSHEAIVFDGVAVRALRYSSIVTSTVYKPVDGRGGTVSEFVERRALIEDGEQTWPNSRGRAFLRLVAPSEGGAQLAERRLAPAGAEHSLFTAFGGAGEEDLGGVHVERLRHYIRVFIHWRVLDHARKVLRCVEKATRRSDIRNGLASTYEPRS